MAYWRNCEINSDMEYPHGMQRIALGVEYAGAGYNGFQRQLSTTNTVQENLERALSDIAQEPITTVCAGRTDAGVHATGQVVHFDTLAARPDKAWFLGGNTKLPSSIRIQWAKKIGPRFHARFSASSRTYRYIFFSGPVSPANLDRQITYEPYTLDYAAMVDASSELVGTHDFTSFRSSRCQASNPVRTVEHIRWARQGALVAMEIKANAFLHHMVRNIVGSLLEIGRGKADKAWLGSVLAEKNRCSAGSTALPCGLYLIDVDYPEHFALPKLNLGPAFFHWNDHSTL